MIDGVNITVKGNKDLYNLATGHTNDYSYSISLDEGIELKTMLELLQNCMD